MATPANRAKIQLVRGTKANIDASLSDLLEGELCYAKDQNRLYMVEGGVLTQVEADPEDIEGLIASIIIGGTGITKTHDDANDTVTLDLTNTGVSAGSYGSSTAIPQITVNSQGQITAASTASISTDMTVAADSGSNQTISIGTDTFTISGGTGLSSATSADTVTVNLDNTAVTAGTYGSASAIPSITVDAQGRITAASTNAIDTDLVTVEVHNQTGAQLDKGKPVYVSGTHSSGKPTVALADNDGTSTYPAIGLVFENIANGADGNVIISGLLTNVATSSYSAGDALYLDSTPGDLTTTRPTASTKKVQKVGLVTRSHATNGSILIIGAGRTNDVNNEITALTGVALNATDLGTFSGTTIADNETIKGALEDLETAVEGAQSSISLGTANQIFAMNAGGTAFGFVDDVIIPGNLTVNGTTTTVNSTTVTVDDKNIELGSVTTPTDVTADGGGITLLGTSDHSITWLNATDAWTFSEHVDLASGKEFKIAGTSVLSGSTLGSGVTGSSLTSVGTLISGTWSASTIAVNKGGTGQTSYTDGQLLIGNSTGNTLSKATLTAGSNVTITNGNGSIQIAATDTNTTYTAGDGLDLTGTEFSVDLKANGGLVIESTELAVDLGASSITGTLGIADGGTGQVTAPNARTALGLAIGTDVQAFDQQLSDIAGLATTDGGFIVGDGSNFVLETGATARASLGVDAAGTDNSTPVTLDTSSHDYLSLTGQEIALGAVDLAADVTGTLPVSNGGTGITAAPKGSVLIANTANTISALDGGGTTSGMLFYNHSTDTIAWEEIDGGTY